MKKGITVLRPKRAGIELPEPCQGLGTRPNPRVLGVFGSEKAGPQCGWAILQKAFDVSQSC